MDECHPPSRPYAGLECGQGLLWTLFYGNGRGAANATSKLATEAHLKFPEAFPRPARLVDRCVYNYQREKDHCAAGFNCSDIVGFHKGHKDDVKGLEDHDAMCQKPKAHSGLVFDLILSHQHALERLSPTA